jgi:hypothetical protein
MEKVRDRDTVRNPAADGIPQVRAAAKRLDSLEQKISRPALAAADYWAPSTYRIRSTRSSFGGLDHFDHRPGGPISSQLIVCPMPG